MEAINRISVYMDHFKANVILYTNEARLVKTILSEFNQYQKDNIIQKGESHFHNKEQELQTKFYKEISDNITDYKNVMLFGTTNAKTEFSHILAHDNRFNDVEISIKNTDKLSPNKQIAFVNNCFYFDKV